VLLETPQNPTLGLVDIAAVVGAAGSVPVVVDNTFATPVLQNPGRHGATLVVHSATKYLGGSGDVVGGVVATSDTQMSGPGAMLAFEVAGGHDAAARVMREVQLITPAVSLGATDSLIEHPAGLTHRLVDPEVRLAAGITPGLLRLSVGLEDADDLWNDLERALASSQRRLAAAT
jgi:methionine-gamma-lyase